MHLRIAEFRFAVSCVLGMMRQVCVQCTCMSKPSPSPARDNTVVVATGTCMHIRLAQLDRIPSMVHAACLRESTKCKMTRIACVQVFFESSTIIDGQALRDALQQLVSFMQNPLAFPLVKARLHPAAGQYRKNWRALLKSWEGELFADVLVAVVLICAIAHPVASRAVTFILVQGTAECSFSGAFIQCAISPGCLQQRVLRVLSFC
jgi:hypothetical protein